MVALRGFLQPLKVLTQRVLGLPRRAVDALKHLVVLVAAPVGARYAHQFERRHLAGRRNVRPPAQIDERVVGVRGDGVVLGDRHR